MWFLRLLWPFHVLIETTDRPARIGACIPQWGIVYRVTRIKPVGDRFAVYGRRIW
jgi:hypothetical protein